MRRGSVREGTLKKKKTWWEPMALFASHIGNATAIFLLLGTVASGTNILLRQLEQLGLPPFALWLLTMLDYATLGAGALLYLGVLSTHTWRMLKEMLK